MKRRACLIAGLGWIGMARAAPPPAERARIERLIEYVASQDSLSFVRSGVAYSPKETAKFLRRKLKTMGEHVNTAQQFIDQIAARSSTTGEPYVVRRADGGETPVADFLGAELRRMDR